MYCTYRKEETTNENQAGQVFSHLLCGVNGEVQQGEDAIRQGVRAELEDRCV
jgi:hypothetical protein